MSDAHVHWVIPRELKKELERESQEKGFKSVSEYVTFILQRRHLVFQDFPIDRFLKAKLVVVAAPRDVYCFKCSQLIPKGTECGWIVGTSINICYRCLMEMTLSAVKNMDRELLKKALSAYESYVRYSTLAREARKELDKLVRARAVLNDIEKWGSKIDSVVESLAAVANKVEKAAFQYFHTQGVDVKPINELLTELDKVRNELKSVRAGLLTAMKLAKAVFRLVKRKRKEVEEYEEGM